MLKTDPNAEATKTRRLNLYPHTVEQIFGSHQKKISVWGPYLLKLLLVPLVLPVVNLLGALRPCLRCGSWIHMSSPSKADILERSLDDSPFFVVPWWAFKKIPHLIYIESTYNNETLTEILLASPLEAASSVLQMLIASASVGNVLRARSFLRASLLLMPLIIKVVICVGRVVIAQM